MKITKAQLKQIIKEEIEEAMPVSGGGGYGSPSRFLKKRLKRKVDISTEPTLAMPRKTQAEKPEEMTDKVSDFIELIAASNLSREEKDRLMQALRENNMKLVKEILLEIYKVEQ